MLSVIFSATIHILVTQQNKPNIHIRTLSQASSPTTALLACLLQRLDRS
jgi:hypothetical protein